MTTKEYEKAIYDEAVKLLGCERLLAHQISGDAVSAKYNFLPVERFVYYEQSQMLDADFRRIGHAGLEKWYNELPQPPIKEGTPCTIVYYSDRRAGTITKVEYNKQNEPIAVNVANNVVECKDYYAGYYDIKDELDETGTDYFTRRRGGGWYVKGHSKKDGVRLAIGYRRHYIDPSF